MGTFKTDGMRVRYVFKFVASITIPLLLCKDGSLAPQLIFTGMSLFEASSLPPKVPIEEMNYLQFLKNNIIGNYV